MRYLFISFIFSILALIDAASILSPNKNDKWTSGSQTVRWNVDLAHVHKVDLFIHRDSENPPYYFLLGRGLPYRNGLGTVELPSKLPPGNDYSVLLTGENPYNVYARSEYFSVLANADVKNPNCYEYLVDDGSSTIGPKPGESLLPETTDVPLPTETDLPDDCEDCEECDDEVCGECLENDVCDSSECASLGPGSYGSEPTTKSKNKVDVTDVGSINRITGFLLVLITISSILFL
ncbi:hypothetical protein PCANB_001838 [Pneumocystis canis]|nr:hypothetical protein PCANB_001838 [Pneumocystis canis]